MGQGNSRALEVMERRVWRPEDWEEVNKKVESREEESGWCCVARPERNGSRGAKRYIDCTADK